MNGPQSHLPAGATPLPSSLLPLLGLLLVAALAAFGWLDGIPLPLPRLLLPAAAFLAYGAAGLTATRAASGHPAPATAHPADSPRTGPSPRAATHHPATATTRSAPRHAAAWITRAATPIALIWAVAILARLALLPLAPELSDDIYRYLWDGHLLTQGVNPYAHPPGDEALAALRTPWHGEINHPEVPTIYPPLSQLLFGAVALLGGAATGSGDAGTLTGGTIVLASAPIIAAKLVWLGFDLGCGLLLHRIARRTGRNPAPVLIWYLWSPLLIVETAWSAHFDAVGLFLLAALILVAGSRERVRGPLVRAPLTGALLAAATLIKFAPAAALPVLVRRHGTAALLTFAAVCAAFYLPFATIGSLNGVGPLDGVGLAALTEGLRTYARHWTANEGAFAVIAAILGDPVQARAAATALVLAVVAYVTWRRLPVERALLWIIGAGLLLSPTVHPWYVLWVLPMAALRGNRPFLLLGGLAFLGYWGLASYQATGVWPQPLWNRVAIWVPVWALLLTDLAAAFGRARARAAGDRRLRRRTGPASGRRARPEPDRQIPRREEPDERQ